MKGIKRMNEAKRKYQKQCKIKTITFYKKDADLLNFANSINFQKEVKDFLRRFKRYSEEVMRKANKHGKSKN